MLLSLPAVFVGFLRITGAKPGQVMFELDVRKEHTVSIPCVWLDGMSAMGARNYAILPYSFTNTRNRGDKNRMGSLHGGTIASIVDLGGSLAVASRGLFATGVSIDLNVSYLSSGGKIGDKIRAEATCDKFGKTLVCTSIRFMNDRNELFARGSHTKYVAVAWRDPNNNVKELLNNGSGPRTDNKPPSGSSKRWVFNP